jgi:hypothetical protein
VHQQDGHLQQPETAKLIQVVMQITERKGPSAFFTPLVQLDISTRDNNWPSIEVFSTIN